MSPRGTLRDNRLSGVSLKYNIRHMRCLNDGKRTFFWRTIRATSSDLFVAFFLTASARSSLYCRWASGNCTSLARRVSCACAALFPASALLASRTPVRQRGVAVLTPRCRCSLERQPARAPRGRPLPPAPPAPRWAAALLPARAPRGGGHQQRRSGRPSSSEDGRRLCRSSSPAAVLLCSSVLRWCRCLGAEADTARPCWCG